MNKYNRDYSVTEVKQMLTLSEKKNHPFNPSAHGHGQSLHHAISDANVNALKKSAFVMWSLTNLQSLTLDPAAIGQTQKMIIKSVSDQPFMVAAILNSNFGQAALALLNQVPNVRITIHAKPPSTPGAALQMRMKDGASVKRTKIEHVVMVIDNNGKNTVSIDNANVIKDYLHFVTAYPTNSPQYKFKIGASIPRTRPGVEGMMSTGQKGAWLWSSDRQEDDGTLIRVV